MTVYIEKPSLNLREELASLRNQGGYEERQFYFDGLVTNGTFDADTSGWSANNSSLSAVSGRLRLTQQGGGLGFAQTTFATVVGKVYRLAWDYVAGTAPTPMTRVATSTLGSDIASAASTDASITFVAQSTTTYVNFRMATTTDGLYSEFDNISVFETDGTDVVHRMPKGWVPLHVYEDGLLQREGAAHDYEVVYDGFDYYVKPAVAPGATTETCVIGVRK